MNSDRLVNVGYGRLTRRVYPVWCVGLIWVASCALGSHAAVAEELPSVSPPARAPDAQPSRAGARDLDRALTTHRYLLLPGQDLASAIQQFEAEPEMTCLANRARLRARVGDVVALAAPLRVEVPMTRRRVEVLAQADDTVAKLAARFDLTVEQLRWINQWSAEYRVKEGDAVVAFSPVNHTREGVHSNGESFLSRFEEPTAMPDGGSLYRLKSPQNAWGTRQTVDALVEISRAHRAAFPQAPELVIGDISRKWGGRFRPHLSHRYGSDVDMALPLASGEAPERFVRLDHTTLDIPRAWEILRATLATGHAQYVFLDYRLQKVLRIYGSKAKGLPDELLDEMFQYPAGVGSNQGIVRHERGHRDHFHIRFDSTGRYGSEALMAALRGFSSPAAERAEVRETCRAFGANALWKSLVLQPSEADSAVPSM